MGDGVCDGGGGVGGEDMYNGRAEPMLVSVLDLYSNDDAISVSDSRYFSYPAYTDTDYFCQLTTALRKCKQFWSKKTVLL